MVSLTVDIVSQTGDSICGSVFCSDMVSLTVDMLLLTFGFYSDAATQSVEIILINR